MDVADFGRYLLQQRELRGLSRGDVVNVTKISESTIAALETGQIDRLPSRMYVLRFIRAYAEAIGLEPEETALRYEELDPSEATLAFNAEPPPPTPLHCPPPPPVAGPVAGSEVPLAPPSTQAPAPVAKRPPSWSRVSELTTGKGMAQRSVPRRGRLFAAMGAAAAVLALGGAVAWFRLHA